MEIFLVEVKKEIDGEVYDGLIDTFAVSENHAVLSIMNDYKLLNYDGYSIVGTINPIEAMNKNYDFVSSSFQVLSYKLHDAISMVKAMEEKYDDVELVVVENSINKHKPYMLLAINIDGDCYQIINSSLSSYELNTLIVKLSDLLDIVLLT